MSWIPVSCSGGHRPCRRDSWIESNQLLINTPFKFLIS